ncbi:cyclin-dependent kinase 2-associated protein 1 isoform X2 [Mugil cephalus]|uniref:cyclin-dependent kinase 2-associated protein 1 isoform X2 n=1 Tax=Mugil cephalus TaxID=48193 RepID=UPI001FB670C0|nr:cyclin-dependent kinase 2-associated protein 1 isoform X2 [Mugil cephalus]
MYELCLVEGSFRFLHDAPRSEPPPPPPIDPSLRDFFSASTRTPGGLGGELQRPNKGGGGGSWFGSATPETGHMTVGSLQSPSAANLATLQSYRPLLSDYGPPSLGFSQGSTGSQVPQNKYAELLAIIEELGKEIRPTYAGSKSAMERLKRGIIHARGLVRECLAETERNARS